MYIIAVVHAVTLASVVLIYAMTVCAMTVIY